MQPEWMLGQVPQTASGNLPSGAKGNEKTIEIMCEVAQARATDPVIRELALNIIRLSGTNSHNFIDEAKAVGEYVKQKVAYVRDPYGVEQLHDPLLMIDRIRSGRGYGDCDDMSLLIATLLLSIGCQPFFRAIKYNINSPNYNHIYVVVYDNNWGNKKQRIVLDAILKLKPIGTELPHQYGVEFSCG
jgi:hypothetical protein